MFLRKYGDRGLKIVAIGRLLTWFMEQPESMRQLILGWNAEDLSHAYAEVLRNMAGQLDHQSDVSVTSDLRPAIAAPSSRPRAGAPQKSPA